MNKQILIPFSQPIYRVDDNSLITKELVDFVKSITYIRVKPPNDNGFISEDTYILNNPVFNDIKNHIINTLKEYVVDIYGYNPNNLEPYFLNSWITKHDKDDYAHSHHHTNSIISGTFYIQVDEKSGALGFKKQFNGLFPHQIEPEIANYNQHNSAVWRIIPKNGTTVLFPSDLVHFTDKSESHEDRYCLAFNIWFKGSFGHQHLEPKISLLDIN
jgi:uncharacterized protein (TIGR02466 family)